MSKRTRDHHGFDTSQKRICTRTNVVPVDRLSRLSNELLLHILSFLPVSSLNVCQRLSHRFHALGGDSELWKRQYHSQWVRPRTHLLAKSRRSGFTKTDYSPKVATWSDDGHLSQGGNWKRRYRLRHNWSKGLCRVTEVEFLQPPCPPALVKFCAGVVFTADSVHGLRAWVARDSARCLANIHLPSAVAPTALAVSHRQDKIEISVGMDNGHFHLFDLNLQTSRLELQSSHVGCNDTAITAMALSLPYLLVASQHKVLTLYNMQGNNSRAMEAAGSSEPCQLASLKADNIVPPMTLSLRVSNFDIIATVVYSFFHIGCGWSLGIQELRLGNTGQQLDSRLATTVDAQHGSRPLHSRKKRFPAGESVDNQSPSLGAPSILHQKPPTSMSYSHPYLLTSHADNTLTMYLVSSTTEHLFVQVGRRLWGHTSAVSAVQVTNRGKAVSVSCRGDEIRVWELEMALSSLGSRKALPDENSVQLSADNQQDGKSGPGPVPGLGCDDSNVRHEELSGIGGYVGFDEERVLLLREKPEGTQILECYDFT